MAELEADKGKGAARLVDLQAEVAALKAQLAAGDKERAELEEALGFMEQVGGVLGVGVVCGGAGLCGLEWYDMHVVVAAVCILMWTFGRTSS